MNYDNTIDSGYSRVPHNTVGYRTNQNRQRACIATWGSLVDIIIHHHFACLRMSCTRQAYELFLTIAALKHKAPEFYQDGWSPKTYLDGSV